MRYGIRDPARGSGRAGGGGAARSAGLMTMRPGCWPALADMSAVEGDSVERAEVLLELAHAEYLACRYDTCLEHCVDAADAAATTGRGDLVARSALVLQGVTYPQAAEALTRLGQRALSYADLGIDLRARVLAQLATMEADSGRVASGEALAGEALALAASGDPLAEIEAAQRTRDDARPPRHAGTVRGSATLVAYWGWRCSGSRSPR